MGIDSTSSEHWVELENQGFTISFKQSGTSQDQILTVDPVLVFGALGDVERSDMAGEVHLVAGKQ